MGMKALHIAAKDLRIFFKDRGAAVLSLILPLVFVTVFSGALAALAGGDAEDDRIALPVADYDGSDAAAALLQGIGAAGGVAVEPIDEANAIARLEDGQISRLLIVPSGFESELAAGDTVTLRLISHPKADNQETEAVRLVVDGVARDMSLESQILASLRQVADMQGGGAEDDQPFTEDRVIQQARSQFERSLSEPLIAVEERVAEAAESEMEGLDAPVQLAVPGFTVLFVFLSSQTAARSIYDEKKVGSFRRLLAAPVSKASLLAGKMIPNVIIGLVQTAVIFLFGMYVMRWLGQAPLSLGQYPWAVLAVVLAMLLCSAALGVLIAALARTENQIGGLSAVLLWAMAVLGGSFVPAMILEQFVGPIPKIVPHYWANTAFSDLLVRGLPPSEVGLELAVLGGFTLVLFAVGVWRFDFD
jgi:ABC-2 type transport system permease protein